jgi:hypothetical protein
VGYVKQFEIVGDYRSTRCSRLGLSEGRSDKGRCDESAVGEAGDATLSVRCSGGTAKQRADRERRLEGLAVAVLTALGGRDAAVRDTETRVGQALQTMTDDEGLSAVERSPSASVTSYSATIICDPGCSTKVGSAPSHASPAKAIHQPFNQPVPRNGECGQRCAIWRGSRLLPYAAYST